MFTPRVSPRGPAAASLALVRGCLLAFVLDGPEKAVELLQQEGAIFEARVDDVEVLQLGRRPLSRAPLGVGVEGEDDAPAVDRSRDGRRATRADAAAARLVGQVVVLDEVVVPGAGLADLREGRGVGRRPRPAGGRRRRAWPSFSGL